MSSSDSESIAHDLLCECVLQPMAKRPRRAKAVVNFGSFILVLLIATDIRPCLWSDCGEAGTSIHESLDKCPPGHAIAIALTHWQHFQSDSDIPAPLLRLERLRSRASSSHGFIGYPLKALARFEEPFRVEAKITARQIMATIAALRATCYNFDSKAWSDTRPISEHVAQWQITFNIDKPPRLCMKEFHHLWLSFILVYLPAVFHIVTIGAPVCFASTFAADCVACHAELCCLMYLLKSSHSRIVSTGCMFSQPTRTLGLATTRERTAAADEAMIRPK